MMYSGTVRGKLMLVNFRTRRVQKGKDYFAVVQCLLRIPSFEKYHPGYIWDFSESFAVLEWRKKSAVKLASGGKRVSRIAYQIWDLWSNHQLVPLPPKISVCSMPLEMASGYYRKAKFLVFKNGLCIISDKNSHSKVLKIGHLAFITAFGCASAVIVSFFQFLEWSWGNMYVYLTSW